MNAGSLAVDIFFVLSGFLISYILLKEHNKTGTIDVWAFYRGRFLRLWPTMLPWALIFSAIALGFDYFASVGFLSTLTFTNNFLGDNAGAQGWSLAVEFQFYILSPLIVFLMARYKKPWVAPLGLFLLSSFLRTILILKVCSDTIFNGNNTGSCGRLYGNLIYT